MNNLCEKDYLSGPFDNCLRCQYLGNGCSGPRTSCMSHDRYVAWLKALKKLRGYTNQEISDGAALSLATVNDIFAGRRKDIVRTTAGMLEDFLIGAGKWPCAMQLASGKEIIQEDRPETLEALRLSREQTERIRHNYNQLRDSINHEMQCVRDEYEDDIKEYKALVSLLKEQIQRKDDYIDRLAKKAGI